MLRKSGMIKSIKTKTLKEYWFKGKPMKLPQKAVRKLQRTLKQLDKIETMSELKETFVRPGFNLQKYKEWGDGAWEIRVSGNWRLLFCFDPRSGHTTEIEYTDETHKG